MQRQRSGPGSFMGNGSVNIFRQQKTRMQQWHNNRKAAFSVLSVPRCYKQGKVDLSQFTTRVCEERTSAREAEESPLLEAVARERLVKTQISDGAVIDYSSESCL
jgi:hypothetical protein